MLISLLDITLKHGDGTAFEHTSWQIDQNQHWAVWGPTGSGKSLLAAALCRKVTLIGGQIRFFFDADQPEGRPYLLPREILTLSAETHRDFLIRYAAYHQARWQSSEGEDVPSVARLLVESVAEGSPDAQAAVDEVLGLFQIAYLRERAIHQLSHGESRKVHLARLLLQAPHLLILDDPMVGLDPESRALLAHAVEVLLERGSPQLLLISSRVEDIPAGVDRLLVVDGLRVVKEGPRADLSGWDGLPMAARPRRFVGTAVFDAVAGEYAARLEDNPLRKDALVEMRRVGVRYGTVPVLTEINWTVCSGERWSLSGHNGAGKTTLLSLILADNPQAYANDLRLFGKLRGSGESIWDIKRHIGWVSPELHIHYPRSTTSIEVVCSGFFDSVGLYQHITAELRAAALRWMDAFGIQHLAEDVFQSLPTGQQRMVLLARALVKDPLLLILDEPCQGLDDGQRSYFLDLLNELCLRAPLAMIYVTHYRDEIPAVITHRLVLAHGKIHEQGLVDLPGSPVQ